MVIDWIVRSEGVHFAEGCFGVFFVSVYCGIPPWFVVTMEGAPSYGIDGSLVYYLGDFIGFVINRNGSVFGILFKFFMENISEFGSFVIR